MKIIAIFAVASVVLGAYTLSLHRAMAQASSTKAESPFYCKRTAVPPEQRQRKEELNHSLRALHRSTHELENGYEFELPSDPATVQAAAEWATMEKLCCPFFDIDLHLECEGGPLFLRLTGRDGVKQFIRSEFARWFPGAV